MARSVEYFRIGRIADIERQGMVRVNLLGNQILVVPYNDSFVAIELGNVTAAPRAFLPNKPLHLHSGTKRVVARLLGDPAGGPWGKFRQFPVKVEKGFVLVGIVS